MPNPIRPWKNFLTVWERLDLDSQIKLKRDAVDTLRKLRAHRKDIEGRITYWENNQDMAQRAMRSMEFNGRSRERDDRVKKAGNPRKRKKTNDPQG